VQLFIHCQFVNEADTIAPSLADLPRVIPGIDRIEVLVIDDGSRDGTADVARAAGVDHVVRLRRNKGLAAAFAAGIDASLKRGADFIVNTDADNQYPGHQIAALLEPLLKGEADIVIGDRNIASVRHMSWRKRQLQRLGSWVVRQVSNTSVPDTTSGFRAYTRDAALRMTIVSEFSYTLESIIQAGKKRMAIAHVQIETNSRTRKSRLFDSMFSYIKRSAATIVRIYAMYEPLKIFTYVGVTIIIVGALISSRFFYTFLTERVTWARHLQSLLIAGVVVIIGVQVLLIGLLADVSSANRKLLEDLLYRGRSLERPAPADDVADAGEPARELSNAGAPRRWDR
jgi:glycosyltransferase involved in cell wall biosynthesis